MRVILSYARIQKATERYLGTPFVIFDIYVLGLRIHTSLTEIEDSCVILLVDIWITADVNELESVSTWKAFAISNPGCTCGLELHIKLRHELS